MAATNFKEINMYNMYFAPTFPLEILDLIIFQAFLSDIAFKDISGFASASYACRKIVFRYLCEHLHICTIRKWAGMPDVNLMSGWVRTLSGAGRALLVPNAIHLRSFRLLRTVHISLYAETIITQPDVISTLLNYLPNTITELSLIELSEVSNRDLSMIVQKFPELQTLELTCAERLDDKCCLGCFEESAGCVGHSPIPAVFPDAQEMTITLRNILRPLTNLRHLHLGIFISPEEVLYEHLLHAHENENENETELDSVLSARHDTDTKSKYSHRRLGPEWCILCYDRYSEKVRFEELQFSLELSQTLKNLETLRLSSFFGRQEREMNNRTTKIWVRRVGGKIRVRRKPW